MVPRMHDRSDDSICPRCHGSGVIALRPDQAAVVMAIAAATDCRRSFSCRELLKHADVVGGRLQSWRGGVSETLGGGVAERSLIQKS
jgi:hypothetical protein